MPRLVLIALLGLTLAGCASDRSDRASSGGTTATTTSTNQDMRGSSDAAPGAEGDRRRPDDSRPARGY